MGNRIGNIDIVAATKAAKKIGYTFVAATFSYSGDVYNKPVKESTGNITHPAVFADYEAPGNRPEEIYRVKSICGEYVKFYVPENIGSQGARQESVVYFSK